MQSRVLLALAVLPAPALAQDLDPAPDIVVTGRGLAPPPGDRAFDVVTIDRDRIRQNASARLEGVLADVAGLQQFRRADSRSANPTSHGLSLRGIGGNASSRALLILDGVPQTDPFGGWIAFPAYATDRIGSIRVIRGGGSGYYGPGALTGTIEMESASPDQLSPVEARAAYGSRASVDAQGSATLTRGPGFATATLGYARGDGFTPIVAEDRGDVDGPAPYEQASAALRGVIAVAPDTEFQATATAFTDQRERGTAYTDNLSQGADASVRLVGRGRWGWQALGYVQTRAFASSFAGVAADRSTVTQTLNQYNTPATGVGARIEISPPLGDRINLRVGGDVRRVSGKTEELYTFVAGAPTRQRFAGGVSTTVGAFANGSVEAGPVTLDLAGRLDRWSITDGFLFEQQIAGSTVLTDTRFADREGTEATGRAGVAWRVIPPLTVRAAGYRGWRLPTLNELYRPFRAGTDATAANAALAPETLTGWEVGATLLPARGVTVAATYFDNRLEDAIANVTRGTGPGTFPGVGFVAAGGAYRVRQNLDAIRSRGVEVDASAQRGDLFARASWSHVAARVEASGMAATLDGLRPAQTPRDSVSATLGWARGGWALSGTARSLASQFDDDQNTRRLADATTFDAFATVPLGRGLSIEARAENLSDTRVETAITGLDTVERATPRTLWIGFRYVMR